jgi:nicotinamidase-related amidase
MPDAEETAGAVLLLIDLQRAIDHPDWGIRNNPRAESHIAALLDHWRSRDWPVWHVRHDSTNALSHYRPGQPGHDFRDGQGPLPGEPVIAKRVNSAFVGTDLEACLKAQGHDRLVVAGVITNNSVETSVRHAGNLGFAVWLAEDACFTFACIDWSGVERSADEVHAMSLANLDGEYCRVVATRDLLIG